jgi:hypothetical protein
MKWSNSNSTTYLISFTTTYLITANVTKTFSKNDYDRENESNFEKLKKKKK